MGEQATRARFFVPRNEPDPVGPRGVLSLLRVLTPRRRARKVASEGSAQPILTACASEFHWARLRLPSGAHSAP